MSEQTTVNYRKDATRVIIKDGERNTVVFEITTVLIGSLTGLRLIG